MSDFLEIFVFLVSFAIRFKTIKKKKIVPTDRPYSEGQFASKTGSFFFVA